MAKYRPIQTRIWKDPDFENYSSGMKLIFLYLCTNELTTESGIYSVSTKTISKETSIPEATVKKLLSNGFKNVQYDFNNNCVFIKNFLKYNGGGSPELIRRSIRKNYEEFYTPLWNEFIDKYPNYSNSLETVGKPLENCSIDIDIELENRNNIKGGYKGGKQDKEKEEKIKYADFVFMKQEEYQKLLDKHGPENTSAFVEKLNNYKGSKGKTYKSDYLAILDWVVNAVMGKKEKVETGPKYKKI